MTLGNLGKDKALLRSELLSVRRTKKVEDLRELSDQAQRRLLSQEIWRAARSVALYMPKQNETGTELLLHEAWDAGKTVYLPRVFNRAEHRMHFAVFTDKDELVVGAHGILEPSAETCPGCCFQVDMHAASRSGSGTGLSDDAYGSVSREADKVKPRSAPAPDIFVIPGVAFDRNGYRVGFGSGYYDRFLSYSAAWKHSRFIGLAYSFQIVDMFMTDKWDQPVQGICTDSEFFWICGG